MTSTSRVDLAAAVRDAGLRVTAPRVAVLSEVTEGKHVTAGDLLVQIDPRPRQPAK